MELTLRAFFTGPKHPVPVRVWLSRLFLLILPGFLTAALPADEPVPGRDCWTLCHSGSTASLRGLCAVSDTICWASGASGTVLKTVDGGTTWSMVGPKGCERMDFRDVHAWDDRQAVIMTAGETDRLYRTTDGGTSWVVVFEHPSPAAFFDGIAFAEDTQNGWLMGDPIDGRLFLSRTRDAGKTWEALQQTELPEVSAGIAGFAASGTNIWTGAHGHVIIGLGGTASLDRNPRASVLITHDHGNTWDVALVPVAASASAGIFSIIALGPDHRHVVAAGGDYLRPEAAADNLALSEDGGHTWRLPRGALPRGFRSAVTSTMTSDGRLKLVCVGPNGTDISEDGGETWTAASEKGFNAVAIAEQHGWAAGSDGRLAVWNIE